MVCGGVEGGRVEHYGQKLTKLFLQAYELEECSENLFTFNCANDAMEGNEARRKNLSKII